jgi:hypothetical protein
LKNARLTPGYRARGQLGASTQTAIWARHPSTGLASDKGGKLARRPAEVVGYILNQKSQQLIAKKLNSML